MVNIIKKGNGKYNKIIRFNCQMCETVFEADKNDFKYTYAVDIKAFTYMCQCPLCGSTVYESDIHSS